MRSPSRWSSAIAAALDGLTVSATTKTRARLAVPRRDDRRRARRSRARRASSSPTLDAPVGEQRRPADDERVAVDDALDAEAVAVRKTRRPAAVRSTAAAAAIARAIGCSDACSSAPTSRSASARSTAGAVTTSTSAILPSVTVPVLSSTIVSTRRVDSSTSGPLIRMPSCAPRPVPTSSAVGVARPSAHGQATISTATVGRERERRVGARRRASSRASPTAIAITTGTKTAGDAVGEPLHRRLARLRVVDELRDLRERGVGADARRLDDEPAADVDGRAGDRVAGARPRPGRSRRSAATGRRRSVPSTTTPSVAIFSPGRTTKRSPTAARRSGRAARCRRRRGRDDLLRAELDQRAQRCAGAALRARLEVAAGEEEHDHDGRDLEVDLVARAACATAQLERHAHARPRRRRGRRARRPTSPTPTSVPSEISVSIVAAPWRRFFQAARWNGQPAQSTTGVASCSASHCQCGTGARGPSPSASTGSESTPRRRAGGAGAPSRVLGGAGSAVGRRAE